MRKNEPESSGFQTIQIPFFLSLAGRKALLTLGPENQSKANLAVMARSPHSLMRLNFHTTKLSDMTDNIEEYSFVQIRRAIEEKLA